jgi:hypothetical protein
VLHVQLLDEMHALHNAPEFGGQEEHRALPVTFLYVPVPHGVHAIPFGP